MIGNLDGCRWGSPFSRRGALIGNAMRVIQVQLDVLVLGAAGWGVHSAGPGDDPKSGRASAEKIDQRKNSDARLWVRTGPRQQAVWRGSTRYLCPRPRPVCHSLCFAALPVRSDNSRAVSPFGIRDLRTFRKKISTAKTPREAGHFLGASDPGRTDDLLITNQLLYH